MKQNWWLVGAIVAVLAVPFGLALREDMHKHPLARDADSAAADAVRGPDDYAALSGADDDENDADEHDDSTATAVGWEQSGTMPPGLLDAYVGRSPGGGPSLGPSLGGLRFGATRGELARDAAEAWQRIDDGDPAFPALTLSASFDDAQRLVRITLSFTDDGTTVSRLSQAWGPPGFRADDDLHLRWHDPATALCAAYDDDDDGDGESLTYYACRPLVEVVDDVLAGRTVKPGMTLDQVRERFGTSRTVALAATEADPVPLELAIVSDDDDERVERVHLEMSLGSAADAVVAELRRRHKRARRSEDDEGATEWAFGATARLTLYPDGSSLLSLGKKPQ